MRDETIVLKNKNAIVLFFIVASMLHYLSVCALPAEVSQRCIVDGYIGQRLSLSRIGKGWGENVREEKRNTLSSRVKSRCGHRCLRAGFSQLVISAGVASPETMVILPANPPVHWHSAKYPENILMPEAWFVLSNDLYLCFTKFVCPWSLDWQHNKRWTEDFPYGQYFSVHCYL